MAKMIEISDEVYARLANQTVTIGESANSIINRLLDLGAKPEKSVTGELVLAFRTSGLESVMTASKFYIGVLELAHALKPQTFERVLRINGSSRVYFARSKEDIENSGNSTQPLQIVGSPFWALTNKPNKGKKGLLLQVLKALKFSTQDITEVIQVFEQRFLSGAKQKNKFSKRAIRAH